MAMTLIINKSAFLTIFLLLAFGPTNAQDGCSRYYPLTEGIQLQYSVTDKKGRDAGTIEYRVTAVSTDGGATVATMQTKFTDEKGKNAFENEYSLSCENDKVTIDYESLLASPMLQQYTEMEVDMTVEGSDIELPNALSVGEQLVDANIQVSISMSGIKMNISIDQTDRKVEKKESVTVPAGTFDCFLLTETQSTTTMGTTISGQNKIWLAEGVGMVKQESYNQRGSLTGSMQLTAIQK